MLAFKPGHDHVCEADLPGLRVERAIIYGPKPKSMVAGYLDDQQEIVAIPV